MTRTLQSINLPWRRPQHKLTCTTDDLPQRDFPDAPEATSTGVALESEVALAPLQARATATIDHVRGAQAHASRIVPSGYVVCRVRLCVP